ncbi:MAG: ferrous iron transport protein B [Elusimicrobiota bacterium]
MPPSLPAPLVLRRLLLVGRPNVGKSVLFHALTGCYAAVSNYSGTTLELLRARTEEGEVVDTPGLLSLHARTDDEAVTRDELLARPPEVLLHVASATDLEGALTLTFDLARLGVPLVLALNLSDEARAKGFEIDVPALSRALGVPVVRTAAVYGEGVSDLRAALDGAAAPARLPPLPAELERAAAALAEALPESARPWALAALTGDDGLRRALGAAGRLDEAELAEVERARRRFSRSPAYLFLNAARQRARELAARTLRRTLGDRSRAAEAFGRWALGPWSGVLGALLALAGLYVFVGVFGAQVCVDFLQDTVFGKWVNPALSALVVRIAPWALVRDLLVGPYGLFTMALTYAFALILPVVTTFFIAFGLLEDSGYLPRFSVVTDRVFRLVGLNGKAVLPMLLGLGCGSMAVVTTRVLETRRERLLVSFLLALTVPCSAQLGLILGMAGGSDPRVLWVWLGTMLATLVGVGWAASRAMPGAAASFVLEIPPMRLPRPANVLRKVWMRLRWYTAEVVPLFALATFVLFVLDRTGGLGVIERAAAPLVTGLLGLPREAAASFLIGFLRRDYGAAGLYQLHREGLLDPRQTAVALTAITLFLPCMAQWLLLLREHGAKVCAAVTAFVLLYALGAAALVSRLWGLFA